LPNILHDRHHLRHLLLRGLERDPLGLERGLLGLLLRGQFHDLLLLLRGQFLQYFILMF
jgi:hypothetical protein